MAQDDATVAQQLVAATHQIFGNAKAVAQLQRMIGKAKSVTLTQAQAQVIATALGLTL